MKPSAALTWVLAAAACAGGGQNPAPSAPSAPSRSLPTAVDIEPLAEGVWIHRSTHFVERFGDVSANGLVVASAGGALIVDTAWTSSQTAQLLDWTAQNVGPVRAVLVTHWHADRTGGLPEVRRRGIVASGGARTAAEASAHGGDEPSDTFDDRLDLRSLGVEGEAYFPGAGHSRDNLVVWLPDVGVLFGGCLVKAAEADSLGNVADGDLAAWPGSIARLEARYPAARIVVPGHGAAGGLELLVHTRELLVQGN